MSPRAGRLLALLCLACVLLAGCNETIVPPKPSGQGVSSQAAAAQRALDVLGRALRSGRAPASLSAPTEPKLVDQVVANARALQVRDVSLSYVDTDDGALSPAQRSRYGAGAWVGAVDVSYRLGVDTGPTSMEMSFTFVPDSGNARLAAIGGHGDRSALWLRGPVRTRRTARTLVVDAGTQPVSTYTVLARQAVSDVNRVLPRWRGTLVLEVPADEPELDSVLHAPQSQYADIAAVTTTVDGTLVPGTPVHVFLNPAIFDTLRTKGAQVVISHEATHVATKGPFAKMPTWLLEGFADYVALDHAGVPVRTAAAQILHRIRSHGLPRSLPTAADLDPTASGLGATYEEAWLACRYLAATYGEAKLVTFYQAVDAGRPLPKAFSSVLGVSQAGFVRGWRADLARLSGRS